MSSRDKPYRSKASSAFFELVQSALQSTFFLVQESGPTSFALKDEHGKLIKVSLGSTHACTCGGGRSEHCLHTLYVLLKIFRVLPDNPIIWQVSFIDSEINFLIRNRANPIVEKKTIKNQINSQVNRIDLKEEFGCPICQEDLKESDVLIFCKVGCGHNFHVKCMKMWAEYKVSQKENISCPLCRCNWGNSVLNELQRLEHKTKKKKAIHSSTACLGCGASPITGPKYHCLICPDFDFCSKCYNCAHKEHPFIKKLTPSSKWESCPRVNPESLANREFSPNDYELLQQLDSKPCLSEYLFSALPDSAPDVCHLCKNELPGRWKRLACGHSAHDSCILGMIRDEDYYCPVDMKPCLLGLGCSGPPPRDNLSLQGLRVGNPALAFRQRRKPIKRQESQPIQNNRPTMMELPPLIVTRLVRKI